MNINKIPSTPGPQQALKRAYEHCVQFAHSHYENFPVASWFLPKRLREPIAVIYAFARSADDLADEGTAAPATRLARLEDYRRRLERLDSTQNEPPIFLALADVIAKHQLPIKLFQDLITAFALDVTKNRYANIDELLDYCRHSANPVGRLLLHLQKAATPENLAWSDDICSALQLINFYQDLAQDHDESGRIYLPQDEMRRFGISDEDIAERRNSAALRELMDFQIQRARAMMLSGAPLGRALPGRFGLELRMIIQGGLQILNALQRQREDVFARPRLTKRDWITMAGNALTKKPS